MSFSNKYPEYDAVADYIARARLERSVAVGNFIANAVAALARGLGKAGTAIGTSLRYENNLHALEVDALFKKMAARG